MYMIVLSDFSVSSFPMPQNIFSSYGFIYRLKFELQKPSILNKFNIWKHHLMAQQPAQW